MRRGGGSGTATVLFTDLVGSTDLMSQLGPVAFDEVRRAHFIGLRAAIDRAGGEEVKSTGDGVMVIFGSAVDAIRCAIGMQQATERQSRMSRVSLAIRVGLALGEVSFEDDDVFGVPVVEAARLVAAARGGQILATSVVRMVEGGRSDARFVDLGPIELKGLPQPVPICEVAWEPAGGPVVPMPTLLTEVGRIFVGREGEVDRLGQLWKEAAAGHRRVVLLAGEPGVGKTRLAAEIAESAHVEGAVVLAGRCDEDLGVPYQPFVEALRHFVEHAPAEDLALHLGRYGGELPRLVPEVAERAAGLPAPLHSDPETERYRLFDAVAAWLAATSAHQPVLLMLDDLQWAAKPTLLLLRHIVRSPDLRHILILGTYRDTELGHDHPLVEMLADLRRQDGVDRLSLLGLDSSGVATFMEQAAGHRLDEGDLVLARAIHEETEGNPFFVREVLRHLAETGAIERREGRWATSLPIEEVGIPEGVREVVGRRLLRLSGEANRLLRVASVLGPEFELSVLRAAEDFAEGDLVAALEEVTEARLLIETPGAAERYRFTHALVRDTLYGGLSNVRRLALHRRVAESIEVVHRGHLDDHLPALAHHWTRASAPASEATRAADYSARAGDRALAQLAHDEAVHYYRQALELFEMAGELSEPRRLELLIALGEAQRRAGEPAHRETLLEAAHLAHQRGDAPALARAGLANTRGLYWSAAGKVDTDRVGVLESAIEAVGEADPLIRARLLATLGLELVFAGDPDYCQRLSDDGLAVARRTGDRLTLAYVLLARFLTVWNPNTPSERVTDVAELLSVVDELDDPTICARAHVIGFLAALETGDIEAARRCIDVAERLAAEGGQPAIRWAESYNRVGRLFIEGRFEEAERLAGEALKLGQASGQAEAQGCFAAEMFVLRREQGRLGEVEAPLVEAAEAYPELPLVSALLATLHYELDRPDQARLIFEKLAAVGFIRPANDRTWLTCTVYCALVAARLGDRPRAAALYELVGPFPNQLVIVGGAISGSVALYTGMLAGCLGRFSEAEAAFAAAEEFHTRLQSPLLCARTWLEWARVLRLRDDAGDEDRVRQLLGKAVATARELGLVDVERRAVALLESAR